MSRTKYRNWMLVPAAVALSISALVLLQNFSRNEARAMPAGKPNVIVIMADDLGYADVSLYKGGRVPTPHLERLAKQGVLFTQGYSAAPMCSPSRAGLMTGRYPSRFGHDFNLGVGNDNILGLPLSEITIAQALKGQGYATSLIGKWHLGGDKNRYPTARGFDEFYGFIGGASTYIDYKRPEALIVDIGKWGTLTPERGDIGQIVEGRNRTVVNNLDKYLTEDLTEHAVDFIRRNSDKPFFLYAAYNAPHTPLQVTKKYYDRFAYIKDHGLRVYTAMIAALDDGIGEILKTLDDEGLAQNTIVVFISDNGCAGYVPGLCTCEPLRGSKTTHYEGGTRIPFVMRWPGVLPQGKVYDERVSAIDIFPTVMAAVGAKLASDRVYDGVDLRPYLTGANLSVPHAELQWLRPPQASMIAGDWKLWKSDDGKINYLFNLKDDPKEKNNLYSKRPDKVAELSKSLAAYRAKAREPRWPSTAPYIFDLCGEHFDMPR